LCGGEPGPGKRNTKGIEKKWKGKGGKSKEKREQEGGVKGTTSALLFSHFQPSSIQLLV